MLETGQHDQAWRSKVQCVYIHVNDYEQVMSLNQHCHGHARIL